VEGRKVNPKRERKKECEMAISARERYLWPGKHHSAIVMDVISIPVHPLEYIISRTVHHVSVIHTIKQNIKLYRERYIEA
jgi:hypothetical protein